MVECMACNPPSDNQFILDIFHSPFALIHLSECFLSSSVMTVARVTRMRNPASIMLLERQTMLVMIGRACYSQRLS